MNNIIFDGINTYGIFGSNSITGTNPLTLSGWINSGTHSDFGLAVMIGNGITSQSYYIGYVLSSNSGGISNTIGGGLYGSNYGSGISASTGWHDVCITYAGGSNAIFSLYVDGALSLTSSFTPNLQTSAIYLGKANTGTSYFYKGGISNVKLYNRALSSTEVLQNYNAIAPRFDTIKTITNPQIFNTNTLNMNNLSLLLDAADYMSYPGSGLIWNDISGNNIKASIGASFSYLTTYSGALSFDGTSSTSLITIPDSITTRFATASTWAVSIAFSTNTATQSQQYPSIFGKGNSALTNSNSGILVFFTRVGTKDRFGFKTSNMNDIFFDKYAGSNIILTITYDTIYYRLYVNGKYYKTSSVYRNGVNATNPLYIAFGDYLSAINIYQFSKYNGYLTSTDILQNYNTLRTRLKLDTIVNDIISVYNDRVTTTSGTLEGTDNTYNYLSNLDSKNLFVDATWVNIPGAYKSGLAYTQFPNYQSSGNSDITYSRSTSATRLNSSNVIETMALHSPRVDYSQGVPCLLFEPSRTNQLTNTETMTSWLNFGIGAKTASSTITPSGKTNSAFVTVNGTSSTNGGIYAFVPNGMPTGTYVVSVFAKAITANCIIVIFSNFTGGSGSPQSKFDLSNGTSPTTGAKIINYGNGWYRCISSTYSFTGTPSGVSENIGIYIAQTTSTTVWPSDPGGVGLLLYGAQLEQGSYETSYIPATTPTSRAGTIFNTDNIYTNGLIGTQSGSWFVDLRNNLIYTRDTSSSGVQLRYNGAQNGISIRKGPDNTKRNSIEICSDGLNFVGTYYTTATASKLAITWGATALNIYENGIKVVTNLAFTQSGMQQLYCYNNDIPRYIAGMSLWDYQLSDSQSIALTS